MYLTCSLCKVSIHPADKLFGLENRYTVGARRLIVMAGASWSFDKAEEHLAEFCGLQLSDNTIRELCQQESVPMGRHQRKDPEANRQFLQAADVVAQATGAYEFTCDGTCVNTVDGWRELRIGMFAVREFGASVHADQWANRKLPKPLASVAFAGIEDKEQFRKHWDVRAKQLNIDYDKLSVLADGAHWIWDSVSLEFGKVQECLDVYHALEHLSATGKALYGAETPEYKTWREETTLELMWSGYTLIEQRLDRLEQEERTPQERESIRLLRGYLSYHRDRLNYAGRLAEGRVIGGGQVEGACKNMIGRRLKQTGAKWRVRRVNRMATLCAVLYSEQWKDYWNTAK